MERSALRSYRCARCGQLALVCRGCEHNQIYCNRGCAKQARVEGQRRAEEFGFASRMCREYETLLTQLWREQSTVSTGVGNLV